MDEALTHRLSTDPVIIQLLTGGVYGHGEIGEISRQLTPNAFDENNEVLPTCLYSPVSMTFQRGSGIRGNSAFIFELHFYQRMWYGTIKKARERAYDLLHDQFIAPAVQAYPHAPFDTSWKILHESDILRTEDNALNCRLEVSRFIVNVNRRGSCRKC